MRDAETLFADVRRDAESAFRHDFAAVHQRARRRKRRRQAVVGAATAAAVTLSVVAYSQVRSDSRGGTIVGVPGGPTGSPAPDSTVVDAPFPAVAFNASQLYLPYYDECPNQPCTRMIATTADGGKTWRKTRLLDPPGPTTLLGVSVLGPLTAALQVQDLTGAVHVLVTADGGATWRRTTALPPVSALPPNAFAVWQDAWNGDAKLLAVDPTAGTVASLTSQPGLSEAALVPGLDLTAPIWVWGKAADGRAATAVSNDRGRTWSTHVFAEAGDSVVATRDGRTAYIVVDQQQPPTMDPSVDRAGTTTGPGTRNPPVIWVTQDGGTTWQRATGILPSTPVKSAAVLPDGALVVRIGSGYPVATFRSDDAARTFTEGAAIPGVTLRTLTDGTSIASDLAETSAVQRTTGIKPNQVYLSKDGKTWTAVPYPTN
jgi:photosystem II stability/assembly factor-like uncharacterized protein